MKSFEYLKPLTAEEASNMLVKYGGGARILNGGTDLLVRMRDNLIEAEYVIDIKGIPDMNTIREVPGEGLFIGAAVTMNDVINNELITKDYYILAESAHSVASFQLRNRATIVGNVCNASPSGDTIHALVVLDARLRLYGPEGTRTIPVLDFILGVRKTALKDGEIVLGVILPEHDVKVVGAYYKLSRRKDVDLAIISVAASYDGSSWKLCYGAVAPVPVRGFESEKELNMLSEINEEGLEKVAETALKEITPISDVRASREYRLDMVRVALKRTVLETVSRYKVL